MRNLSLLLFIIFMALALSACTPTTAAPVQNKAGLDLSLDQQPLNGMQQGLTFTLVDKDKKPVDGATVEIEGNMNHPGMAPVMLKAEGKGNGKYTANIQYTMGGEWSLTVTAKTPAGDSVVKTFSTEVKQ